MARPKRFGSAKTLPQGEFTSPEDVKSNGVPTKFHFVGKRPELDLPWERLDMVDTLKAAL